jgi:hypothetical protein
MAGLDMYLVPGARLLQVCIVYVMYAISIIFRTYVPLKSELKPSFG